MLNFCPFQLQDYSELETMIFELYADDKATTLGSMSRENVQKTVSIFQSTPSVLDITMFIFEEKIVGYAILTWFWSNEFGGRMVLIDELFVKESYRNRGFSTQFFKTLFAEKKYGEVGYLLEVGIYKADSARLYERLGFQPFKTKHLFR
ncbi:MAG: GNAT family N-acetyltransferase [Saprospiraceae bacterium]|nr:GNAT family N-acetyltransferase [Saprospiraceae bacterium]